jgi:hypothetical protein
MYALDWYLVGYHFLFLDMCFCIQVWGYGMPHICSFSYSYPLALVFSILYIHWEQCMTQVWGYEKTKDCPNFVVMSFLSIWLSFDFGLNFIGGLKVMNT